VYGKDEVLDMVFVGYALQGPFRRLCALGDVCSSAALGARFVREFVVCFGFARWAREAGCRSFLAVLVVFEIRGHVVRDLGGLFDAIRTWLYHEFVGRGWHE
jgi:hypothetical protein